MRESFFLVIWGLTPNTTHGHRHKALESTLFAAGFLNRDILNVLRSFRDRKFGFYPL